MCAEKIIFIFQSHTNEAAQLEAVFLEAGCPARQALIRPAGEHLSADWTGPRGSSGSARTAAAGSWDTVATQHLRVGFLVAKTLSRTKLRTFWSSLSTWASSLGLPLACIDLQETC